jgi:hypothetical protein
MAHGFFNLLSPYTRDPIAAAHAEKEVQERRGREQERAVSWVAGLIVGAGFKSVAQMTTFTCARACDAFGRALTEAERRRIVAAVLELWSIANPVEVFTLTPAGRAALAECWDCFEAAAPDDVLCPAHRATHVTPDRSELRSAERVA